MTRKRANVNGGKAVKPSASSAAVQIQESVPKESPTEDASSATSKPQSDGIMVQTPEDLSQEEFEVPIGETSTPKRKKADNPPKTKANHPTKTKAQKLKLAQANRDIQKEKDKLQQSSNNEMLEKYQSTVGVDLNLKISELQKILAEKTSQFNESLNNFKVDKEISENLLQDYERKVQEANAKISELEKDLEKAKGEEIYTERDSIMDLNGLCVAFNQFPKLIKEMKEALSGAVRKAPTGEDTLDEALNASDNVLALAVSNSCNYTLPFVIPEDETARWTFFDEKVVYYANKSLTEYKYALVHQVDKDAPENKALHDLAKGSTNHKAGKFFTSKVLIARVASDAKTLAAYTVRMMDNVFLKEVSLFCTCFGTSKGISPDGHARAGLPREAINAFIDHCIWMTTKKKELKVPANVNPKTVVSRAINTFLQKRRLDYKFEGTAEQRAEYNKRNKKEKKKEQTERDADLSE